MEKSQPENKARLAMIGEGPAGSKLADGDGVEKTPIEVPADGTEAELVGDVQTSTGYEGVDDVDRQAMKKSTDEQDA